MAGPPDDRTRRMPAVTPPPAGGLRETVHAERGPDPYQAELLDRVRAVQRWLALVGVLALAALGTALYAVLSEDEEGGRDARGASRQSVSDLRDRVETLEDEIGDRATKSSVSSLRSQQEELDERIAELDQQAGEGDADAAQQALEELRGDLQELDQRLEAVEQQAAGETGGTGSP
jgi:TolA-binding protein